MGTRLPTAEEINVFDSLDERCAVKNFLGKDLDQAQALFREISLYYQEDLMWMGPKAFARNISPRRALRLIAIIRLTMRKSPRVLYGGERRAADTLK